MSLSLSATFTLGNLKYDVHAVEIIAWLAPLPGVGAFQAVLPRGVDFTAAVGDDGQLELDGGDGSQKVLTGKISASQNDTHGLRVTVSDAGAGLGALRPAATYEKQSAKDVIRALAGDAGVSIGSLDIDLPLAVYVAHQGRTAAEHIASLAVLGGALAVVNADNELDVFPRPGTSPDSALRYGREISQYQVTHAPGLSARRVALGSGPAGSATAPDALRQTLGRLPDSPPDPGVGAVWQPAAILRAPSAAKNASQALESQLSVRAKRLRAVCFLIPALRPGQVIEVQDVPDGLDGGPWLVTAVRHQLRPGSGGRTVFSGVSAGQGEAGSLLGSALSALGGLL